MIRLLCVAALVIARGWATLGSGLHVALHAQVAPDGDKVVGSVVTTDGMKAALRRRHDVALVKIFYPFHYQGFLESSWDLILIEGWFPMLHEFLQIARSHSPEAVILFFCLDPAYPGLDKTLRLDVDGFLTNSQSVAATLRTVLPTEHVLLAADPEVMRPLAPHNGTAAAAGAVFVGAGGPMGPLKAAMLGSLSAALPFGLRLYGSGWDNSSAELRAVWGGVLPRGEIAQAYSDARVVLAFTIDTQRQHGMVNNRVFEALSCGATLLSDRSEALQALGQGRIEFAQSPEEVGVQLARLMQEDPSAAAVRRARARELVLQQHTWAHRMVPVISFYHQLRHERTRRQTQGCCDRPNCPKLLWVSSEGLSTDADYGSVVRAHVHGEFCRHYRIDALSQAEFEARARGLLTLAADPAAQQTHQEQQEEQQQEHLKWLLGYDVLLAAVAPLDGLDSLLAELDAALAARAMHGKDGAQRWVGYLMHTTEALGAARAEPAGGWGRLLGHYDLLLFRDFFERSALVDFARARGNEALCRVELHAAARCDHLFGLDLAAGTMGPGAGNTSDTIWGSREKETAVPVPGKEASQVPDPEDDWGQGMASPPVVVVCFMQHAALCAPAALQTLLGDGRDEAHLVLVGGSWEAWLHLGCVQYEALHRTVHIGPDRPTAWAHGLFAAARLVYIVTPATNVTIWPFVLAAQLRVRIFLPQESVHVEALAGEPVMEWSGGYVNHAVRTVVGKLHGLGSAQSSVTLAVLAVAAVQGQCEELRVLLSLSVQSFAVGRDGQACFLHAGQKRLCMIRLDRPQVLARITQAPRACAADTVLRVELRGNMFADTVAAAAVTLPLALAGVYRAPGASIEQQAAYDAIARLGSGPRSGSRSGSGSGSETTGLFEFDFEVG